jgi:hypothetical protein
MGKRTDFPTALVTASSVNDSGASTGNGRSSSSSNSGSLRGCLKKQDDNPRKPSMTFEDCDSDSISGSSSPTHQKHVSFDSIQILEFPLELGDNPAVRNDNTGGKHSVQRSLSCTHTVLICFVFEYSPYKVREGPPVTISWTPERIDERRLDEYEIFRDRRRDKLALFLSTTNRVERLLSEGYTAEDIQKAVAECRKAKTERLLSRYCDCSA